MREDRSNAQIDNHKLNKVKNEIERKNKKKKSSNNFVQWFQSYGSKYIQHSEHEQ